MDKAKILYPMDMLSTIVGSLDNVMRESEMFSFDKRDEYFHYSEGELLESISEDDAPRLMREGFIVYDPSNDNLSVNDKMGNLVSVIGCILDEWKRGGEPCTIEELENIYNDASEIWGDTERMA